jgi:hypothetical protein
MSTGLLGCLAFFLLGFTPIPLAIVLGCKYSGRLVVLDMSNTGVAPAPDIPKYMAVNCTAIEEHCLVFPNVGADEHSMLVVEPIQEWSDKFMTI